MLTLNPLQGDFVKFIKFTCGGFGGRVLKNSIQKNELFFDIPFNVNQEKLFRYSLGLTPVIFLNESEKCADVAKPHLNAIPVIESELS